jgi:hypothetical protein
VSIPDGAGGFTSDRIDVVFAGQPLGSAFPDVTGAWEVRKTLVGPGTQAPGPLSTVAVTTASHESATPLLIVRN